MVKRLRRTLASFILAVTAILACTALDLPVKTVKGTKYYYYEVRSGETIFGISKNLGISREEIVLHNPAVADGLKKGTTLYFPYEAYAPVEEITNTKSQKKKSDKKTDKKKKDRKNEKNAPSENNVTNAVTEPEPKKAEETAEKKSPVVVVMLPFMLDSDAESRQSRFATEFYKGFLLAADTLSHKGDMINIVAIDTKNDPQTVKSVLATDKRIKDASVIIAPEDDRILKIISDASAENDYYVLNLLNTRDSLYQSNPKMIQGNINHRLMYSKAIDALMKDFKDYTPVIIRNSSGITEKTPFTSALAERYRLAGREVLEVSYDGSLLRSDIEFVNDDPARKYVIIPSSGTIQEFNRFSTTLKNIIESDKNIVDYFNDDPRITVFGYPDWMAFKGDARDMLHSLSATIYSRFCCDFLSSSSRSLSVGFKNWYGKQMLESVPAPAILGYDAGCYIIRNLRSNHGSFNPEKPSKFTGIQSTFIFRHPEVSDADRAGYCNEALYIIRYLPDTATMAVRVF